MSKFCTNIINKNEELKQLKSLDEIYNDIYYYLKENYDVNQLQIYLEKDDECETLYTNSDKLNYDHTIRLEYTQNDQINLIFLILTDDENKKNIINENIADIKIILQVFSQSLYNKFLEKSLNEMSLIDSVTGSYNRSYLDNYAPKILSISNREQKKIAFLKVGIDQFKAVIDEFDYTVGDKVLKALSDTLKHTVRTSDIVIKIDGDEFLVILMNIINEDNATMISEKLINNFSERKVVVNERTEQTLMKTICSGISIYPDDASCIDEIIKKADIALYEARNKGRSTSFIFSQKDTNTIDFF